MKQYVLTELELDCLVQDVEGVIKDVADMNYGNASQGLAELVDFLIRIRREKEVTA